MSDRIGFPKALMPKLRNSTYFRSGGDLLPESLHRTYKEGAAGDTETVYMFGGRTLFLHLDVGEGLYLGTENVVGLYDITVCFSLNV